MAVHGSARGAIHGGRSSEAAMANRAQWFAGIALLACATASCAQEKTSTARADGARVPLTVYEPARAEGCPPLALLSPGAGGDERGLRYLGEALGAQGWRAIAIGHRESGPAALKRDIMQARGIHAGVEKMVYDPALYRARFMDIDAARQWAQSRCRAPFTALIGHSMGAHTVQLEAGAQNQLGLRPSGGFDAYVALLPAGHCDRLAVIDGASHMNFAGAFFAGKTTAAVVPLVETWLAGVRTGRCAPAPQLTGVRVVTKQS